MNDAKLCPKCGSLNWREAQRCHCGYDFAVLQLPGTSLPPDCPAGERPRAPSVVLLGVLLVPAGGLLGVVAAGVAFRTLVAGRMGSGGGDIMGLGAALYAIQWLEVGAIVGSIAGLVATPLVAYRRLWARKDAKHAEQDDAADQGPS